MRCVITRSLDFNAYAVYYIDIDKNYDDHIVNRNRYSSFIRILKLRIAYT